MTDSESPSFSSVMDEANAYSTTRILLHWLSAAVILWATFSGFGVTLLDQHDPLREWVESFNPQLTSIFIPFFAWRLWLAVRASVHTSSASTQERIASAAHKAIYLVVTGVLITGVLMMSHPVTMMTLVTLPQLIHSEVALMEMHQIHHLLCAALAGLVTLHLLAVAMHQIRGKSVLGRMTGRSPARDVKL